MSVLDQIMQVMDKAFDPRWGEAWNRKQVSDALMMPQTYAILLDASGNDWSADGPDAAGFVLSRSAADEEELLLIAVVPEKRGRGVGHLLLDKLFQKAHKRGVKHIFLEMRRNNPAEHLYRRRGFEPIGERRDYYRLADGNRLDAITFGRGL